MRAGCTVQVADVLERMEAEDLMKWAGQFDGTICGDDRYTNEVFAACSPRLKVVSKWGTGIDSIDTKCAGAHDGFGVTRSTDGVLVGNTPGAFTKPVSDSVMSYILQFCRMQVWMDQHMKVGRWHKVSVLANPLQLNFTCRLLMYWTCAVDQWPVPQ